MSTPWNQPPTNSNHADKTNAPRSGRLLKAYANQGQAGNQGNQGDPQSQPQARQPYQPQQAQPLAKPLSLSQFAGTTPRPATGDLGSSKQSNSPAIYGQAPGSPSQTLQGQSMLSNTVNMMRRWSGKVATVAGYAPPPPQPPAPYMERYRSPKPKQPDTPQRFQRSSYRRWKRSRTLRVTMQMRQRRERWQEARPNTKRIWISLAASLIAVLIIASASGAAYGYSYYQSQMPRVAALAHNTLPQTSRIYDRHGTLLSVVQADHPSTPVTYNDIPLVMQNAMIAAEDPSFWNNNGVDANGILRAMVQYVSAGGHVESGGSTITQQVIKNMASLTDAHATDETFQRKLQEAAGAIGLTSQYSKQAILAMYFNVAPFSNATRGIEAAVESYFNLLPENQDFSTGKFKLTLGITKLDIDPTTGKPSPLLGLARASMLAGIPQNPTAYDPTLGAAYKQNMLVRQDYVLNSMMNNDITAPGIGHVTPTIIKQAEALTEQMQFQTQTPTKLAGHFVDWVTSQLAISLGNGDYNTGATILANGGFNIRTTLDATLDKYSEDSIKRHLTEPDWQFYPYQYTTTANTQFNMNDSAAVVLNAHTGEILTMVGSADYTSTNPLVGGQSNAAASDDPHAGTQEGSSFKPFVYATAFQQGWYPGMIVPDIRTYLPNGNPVGASVNVDYHPGDFNEPDGRGAFNDIRDELDISLNIAATKAGAYVGTTDNGILATNLKRLGLNHVKQKDMVASLPLGTSNATVLEMTDAYQTFANGGTRIPAQPILDIWDNYGRNLFHYDTTKPPTVSVFSPEVAYLMTSVLIDETARKPEFGADPNLSFQTQFPECYYIAECDHQVAAKTGTTDKVVNGIDAVPDDWTVGYTPDFAVGVWTGNANGSVMNPNTLGITGAAPIWHDIISAAAGICTQALDYQNMLPCPNITPQSLGVQNLQTVFPKPADIISASLNTYNGLAGGGRTDYVIEAPSSPGLQPQSGGNNNNGQNGGGQNQGQPRTP